MGLLDNIIGGAIGGGMGTPRRGHGIGQTVAAGVLLALLVKAARSQARPADGRSFEPEGQGQAVPQQQGGLGGGLGGILGGLGGGAGGLGSILGGLGGAGALGGLIRQMQQKGYGQQVNSWVSTGPNEAIAPDQLADALGEDTVEDLQQQTGMPRQQLLADLSQVLPEAVHEVTPAGALPADDDELEQHAWQSTQS